MDEQSERFHVFLLQALVKGCERYDQFEQARRGC